MIKQIIPINGNNNNNHFGSGSGSQPSQSHHVPGLLFINVRYFSYGRGHHVDRVTAPQFLLKADQLLPEARVGSHHGSGALHPGVGLQQGDALVLHQISHAQGGGAAHTGVTVHQCPASALGMLLDLFSHRQEEVVERRQRRVRQLDTEVLYLSSWCRRTAAQAFSNADDTGDLTPGQLS